MKKVFMFPGQGSQYLGMGLDLYQPNSASYRIMQEANALLGFSLTEIMFQGPEEILKSTDNTQPAILTHSLALWSLLDEHMLQKDYAVIGHSLGEYTAYIASQRMSFQDGLRLVRSRGQLMSEISTDDLGMAAVLKLEIDHIQSLLQENKLESKIFVANDNCPGQIVISGDRNAIHSITSAIQEKGGRIIPLAVSGAFHSPYMESISMKLLDALSEISFQASEIPLYTNITASPLIKGEEKASLVKQLYQGVRFRESIENLIHDGYHTFIEVGPGKVLQGLVKKINPDVKVLGLQKLEDLSIIVKEI